MKSLAVITKRSLILSLCIMIMCCFLITPVSASAYDGEVGPDTEKAIEKAAADKGLSAVSGSGESLKPIEIPEDGTADVRKAPTDPVEDQGVEITGFTLNRADGGSLIFDYEAVIPEDSDYERMDIVYEYNGITGTETYAGSYEGNEAWFHMYYFVGNVMQDGAAADITKDKEFDVTFTLYAVNSNAETLAVSDPVTLNIKVFDIIELGTYGVTLPAQLCIANGTTISSQLYGQYKYSWSADDSEAEDSQVEVVIGEVTSVTSGSSKVIRVDNKGYGYYLNPLKKGSSEITVKYTLKGKSKTSTKTIKVYDRYLDLQYRQNGKVTYSDMPSGTSAKFTLNAYLYVYNSSKNNYDFKGDVTDYVTFKVPKVTVFDYEKRTTTTTTKVKGSLSGNVLTVKADKSIPIGEYNIEVKGTYGDAMFDDGIWLYMSPELNRVLVNDDFYFPMKGKSSTFDPTVVHYSKGTKKEIKITKAVVNSGSCTIKDKSGKTVNSGDSLKAANFPLTIKANSNSAYFSVGVYTSDTEYAYVWFNNSNNLSEFDVKLASTSKTYTGSAFKPTVTLKYAGNTVSKTGYKITYMNNKNVGSATVKIQDTNNEYNYRYVTFKINPKKPSIKTPAAVTKGLTAKWTAMKTKMSTERITGYQVQVATNKAFTKNKKSVKVAGYSKVSKKITGLKAKTTYYVRVRTYKKIGRTTYYSPWSTVKSVKTK